MDFKYCSFRTWAKLHKLCKSWTGSYSYGGLVFNIAAQSTPTITPNGQPLPTKELEVKDSLAQESVSGQPAYISAIIDDNNGNITFRLQGARTKSMI